MTRKRVLFVDDDLQLLTALRRMFRRQRDRWDMVFVGGPELALAELEATAFDVIVSDLLMPGMRGDALLQLVSQRSPRTIRILLSGSLEPLPASLADHVFAKPCDIATLRAAIAAAPPSDPPELTAQPC